MNVVTMTGRLVKEVKTIAGEKGDGCVFTLACQKDKEHADFFPCSAWGNTATYLDSYTHKGDLLGIRGRLTMYKDKNDNMKIGVVVDTAEILAYNKKEDK